MGGRWAASRLIPLNCRCRMSLRAAAPPTPIPESFRRRSGIHRRTSSSVLVLSSPSPPALGRWAEKPACLRKLQTSVFSSSGPGVRARAACDRIRTGSRMARGPSSFLPLPPASSSPSVSSFSSRWSRPAPPDFTPQTRAASSRSSTGPLHAPHPSWFHKARAGHLG